MVIARLLLVEGENPHTTWANSTIAKKRNFYDEIQLAIMGCKLWGDKANQIDRSFYELFGDDRQMFLKILCERFRKISQQCYPK